MQSKLDILDVTMFFLTQEQYYNRNNRFLIQLSIFIDTLRYDKTKYEITHKSTLVEYSTSELLRAKKNCRYLKNQHSDIYSTLKILLAKYTSSKYTIGVSQQSLSLLAIFFSFVSLTTSISLSVDHTFSLMFNLVLPIGIAIIFIGASTYYGVKEHNSRINRQVLKEILD